MVAAAEHITVPMLPKQLEFMRCDAPEKLYSGAWRAGKTYCLCWETARRASHPGAREGLCRKHFINLRKTTMRTLMDGDGDMPPVLRPGSYTINKTTWTIKIHGGGEIVLFGMDDMQKVGSLSLTGCGVDEAVELLEKDWLWLVGRKSTKVDGLTRQLYGACNPYAPSHHLAVRFGLGGGNTNPLSHCKAITTTSFDNYFLDPEYIEELRGLTGIMSRRYVYGEWVGSDGLVYDKWNRDIHVKARSGPWARTLVCWDDGYTNPFAALLVHLDGDGRMHIAREVYRSKMQREDKIAAVLDLGGPGCEAPGDEASPELIQAMRDNGIEARGVSKSAKKVFEGITQFVQPRLLVAGDGEPRLTVDPSCENVIREMETYEWKSGKDGHAKDEPVKEHDHAMDALRYGVLHVDNAPKVGVTVKPRARRGRGGFNGRL